MKCIKCGEEILDLDICCFCGSKQSNDIDDDQLKIDTDIRKNISADIKLTPPSVNITPVPPVPPKPPAPSTNVPPLKKSAPPISINQSEADISNNIVDASNCSNHIDELMIASLEDCSEAIHESDSALISKGNKVTKESKEQCSACGEIIGNVDHCSYCGSVQSVSKNQDNDNTIGSSDGIAISRAEGVAPSNSNSDKYAKSKNRKTLIIGIVSAGTAAIVIVLLIVFVFVPRYAYDTASRAFENGEYGSAGQLFLDAGWYGDAKDKALDSAMRLSRRYVHREAKLEKEAPCSSIHERSVAHVLMGSWITMQGGSSNRLGRATHERGLPDGQVYNLRRHGRARALDHHEGP